ncbi:MAG: serine/threonine protein kinase [Victivallales bacterium]|nr:serine/threonine protein kinase [Victivallales bacterium]
MIEKYECPDCAGSIEWDDQREDEFIFCPNCNCKLRSPSAAAFKPGKKIGDYEVIRRLGVGGMGEVYLAEQKSMMRPVALKILQKSLVEDGQYLERFFAEIRMLARIEHPNVVRAIETGYLEEDGIYFFSMRYVEGEDLKKRLDSQGKMPEEDALNVIMHVGLALDYVWNKYQIIHRDIKPANIIVTPEGEVKLMDLGISKSLKDKTRADLTMAGMMVGSPYYVSPEQARAEKDIDFRADMYSLGASFYHMLTGKLPFESENAMAIIAAHITDPVPDPRTLVRGISERSVAILMRMMAKKKQDRYLSWDEAIDDIEEAINRIELRNAGKKTSLQSAVALRNIQSRGELGGSGKSLASVPSAAGRPPMQTAPTREKPSASLPSPLAGLISNLYVRFIFLVLALFLTFVTFFTILRKWTVEEREREAVLRFDEAMGYISEMPMSRKGFREALRLLVEVKRVNIRRYNDLADEQIEGLKTKFLRHREAEKRQMAGDALKELKRKSGELETAGRFSEALDLWLAYERDGAFSKELAREIREAIVYFTRKTKEGLSRHGGID